ncbi:MAG: Ig-like domain-containing protein, partial [Propionibacteriaceae bacterium]|nr:Ig-like domain-containing protein [Propionibacteriaceae bacterium]
MTNWVTVGEPTGPGYTGTLVALSTEDKQCDVTSVEFGSTSGDVTVTRAPDGLANGTYYATFTSTVASATPEALAKLNGAQVGVNKPIPFKSDVPDKSKSKVTVNPPTQVVGSPVTVTVALQDKYGNPVTWIAPADIDVTGESGANAAEVKACVLDAASGTYKCEMTAKLVGDYTVEAVVAGTTLDDHPVVTFTHGAVCVSNCEPVDPNHLTRFDMVTNDQPADGKTKDSAEASAYDHYGNVVPGAAVQVVDQSTGALAGLLTPATATATTGTDGTAMVYWTATRSGRYTGLGTIDGLRPTAAGKDVTGGVLSEIRFSQPDVSAKDSDLVVTPASPIVVGNTYTATATIRTATKELVAGAVVSFGVTTDVTDGWTLSKATCTTISDGTCSVTLTAQLVGDYTISATIPQAGVATGINGSPKTVKFTAGEVCVDNPATTAPECAPLDKTHVTRVTVDPNGAVANGSAPDVINVYAYDYYGNAVANAQVVATALGGLTLATATASPQTGTDGTATIGYTSLDATTYLVPVTVGGKTPPTSPAQLSFVDVPVADLKITISPDGPLPVGDTYTVTATAKDVDGKFVKGAVITFPPVAGATVGASCTTNVDGVCTVTLYSETPGTYTVKGRTGTLEAEDTAVYKVGPVDHATVEVVKNGARPDGVDQDVYRVTAYDKFDNPVPGAAVTSTDQSAELTTLAIAPTNKNGQTTVAYTSTKGGVYDATVKVNDVTAVPTVIHPAFGGPAAGGTWSVTPAGPLVVGRGAANSYTLRASLVDDLNRPAAGSVATFTVNPGGPVFPDGPSCVTDTSGTCTVPVYSTKAGTYSVTADTNGLALKSTNNRYAESVVWTPDEVCTVPSGCTPDPETKPEFYTRVIVTEDKAVANGDAYDVATVYAYDQYGNPVPSALVISTTADAKLTIQQGIPGTDAQGESTIQYTSTKAGEHLAAVTIDGKIPVAYNSVNAYTAGEANPVAGQVTLTFVAGPADPKHSYLTVEPKQQLAYDDVAVTATIADKFDNPVAGVTVAFDVTGNATFGDSEATPVAAVTGTTDANGRAAATLTDATNTEEIVQVSARIDVAGVATDIVNSPTDVTFLPRVLAPCSSLSVNKNELPVGEYATATVNVCDDMLHPVPNVTVTITTDSSTTLVNSSQLTTDSSGNAFLKFTDSEAKVVQVTAKLPDGSEVDNSPEKVTFLDVTAPEPPVITTPKDGTATNKPNVEVTGTGEAGATVTVWDKTDPANPVSVCTAVVDAQGNWKCTTTKLADGDHTLVATQTDPAGNTSGPSNEVNIKIDQTPPGAPVFDRTNGSEVSGSAEPGATVVVTDGNGQPIPGCGPMVADADGRFSCDPTTRLVPGTVVKGTA